jgi:hypothetical protein
VAGSYPISHTGTANLGVVGAVAGPAAADNNALLIGSMQHISSSPFLNYKVRFTGIGTLLASTNQLTANIQSRVPAPNGGHGHSGRDVDP